jgi:hypothetical protein
MSGAFRILCRWPWVLLVALSWSPPARADEWMRLGALDGIEAWVRFHAQRNEDCVDWRIVNRNDEPVSIVLEQRYLFPDGGHTDRRVTVERMEPGETRDPATGRAEGLRRCFRTRLDTVTVAGLTVEAVRPPPPPPRAQVETEVAPPPPPAPDPERVEPPRVAVEAETTTAPASPDPPAEPDPPEAIAEDRPDVASVETAEVLADTDVDEDAPEPVVANTDTETGAAVADVDEAVAEADAEVAERDVAAEEAGAEVADADVAAEDVDEDVTGEAPEETAVADLGADAEDTAEPAAPKPTRTRRTRSASEPAGEPAPPPSVAPTVAASFTPADAPARTALGQVDLGVGPILLAPAIQDTSGATVFYVRLGTRRLLWIEGLRGLAVDLPADVGAGPGIEPEPAGDDPPMNVHVLGRARFEPRVWWYAVAAGLALEGQLLLSAPAEDDFEITPALGLMAGPSLGLGWPGSYEVAGDVSARLLFGTDGRRHLGLAGQLEFRALSVGLEVTLPMNDLGMLPGGHFRMMTTLRFGLRTPLGIW